MYINIKKVMYTHMYRIYKVTEKTQNGVMNERCYTFIFFTFYQGHEDRLA